MFRPEKVSSYWNKTLRMFVCLCVLVPCVIQDAKNLSGFGQHPLFSALYSAVLTAVFISILQIGRNTISLIIRVCLNPCRYFKGHSFYWDGSFLWFYLKPVEGVGGRMKLFKRAWTLHSFVLEWKEGHPSFPGEALSSTKPTELNASILAVTDGPRASPLLEGMLYAVWFLWLLSTVPNGPLLLVNGP